MDKEQVQQVVGEYKTHPTDTGSSEVQIALLTHQIRQITEHLRSHRHDHQARYGLVLQVGRRRRLLAYLAREDVASYQALLARLGLRR